MITPTVQETINEQINKELHSAYIYLSMSAYFASRNLPGFAHWMRVQSGEEVVHAMKLFDHLLDRGGRVALTAIAEPPKEFESPLQAIDAAYHHEQKVTASIHRLYEAALKENDYPAQVMLHWFIEEQVEEEKNTSEIVERLKIIGDHPGALLALDRELTSRTSES